MKNEYRLTYQCQMCYQKFSSSESVEAESSDITYLMGKIINNQQYIGTQDYKAPMYLPHYCWNGNIGFAHIIGFKKMRKKS